jgi:hypothetical protein
MRDHQRGLYAGSIRCGNPVRRGGETMHEDLDERVHDAVALGEIDLYADVLSAVAASDRPLTSDEIDRALGLDRTPQPADV